MSVQDCLYCYARNLCIILILLPVQTLVHKGILIVTYETYIHPNNKQMAIINNIYYFCILKVVLSLHYKPEHIY